MINHIKGTIVETQPNGAVVEASGVGYFIRTGPKAWLEKGMETTVLTRLIIREDSHELLGFQDSEARGIFDLLTAHVSGVGPKTALEIVAAINPGDFKKAVASGDTQALSSIKGIGNKTAERILMELRDKVKIAEVWAARTHSKDPDKEDAILALIALGHSKNAAEKAVEATRKKNPLADATTLIKETLKNNQL